METIEVSYQSERYVKEPGSEESWGIWNFEGKAGRHVSLGVLPKTARVRGNTVRLSGRWVENPQYGRQFEFKNFTPLRPKGKFATITFLQQAPGVGPVLSRGIWNAFGEQSIEKLAHSPDEVKQAVGLSSRIDLRKASKAMRGIIREVDVKAPLVTMFEGIPFPRNLIDSVVKTLGGDIVKKIQDNPFVLLRYHGVGFLRCDELRKKLGLPHDMPERMASAAMYVLSESTSDTWISKGIAYTKLCDLIGGSQEAAAEIYKGLYEDGKIAYCNGDLSLVSSYRDERDVCHKIFHVNTYCSDSDWPEIDDETITDHQIEQIRLAQMNGRVAVLMGSAGTGKTYSASAVIRSFPGKVVAACSPTGKAAQRLNQSLNESCVYDVTPTTIHSLLGAIPDLQTGAWKFSIDGVDDFIHADLVVVDEVSMIDNSLLLSLMRAVRPGTRILLLGDPHQLSPIGRGTFLRDWPVWCDKTKNGKYGKLSEILRNQGAIIEACAEIYKGRPPIIPFADELGAHWILDEITSDSNLRGLWCTTDEEIKSAALWFAGETIVNSEIDQIRDVQYIVATNQGSPASRKELNVALQEILNKSGTNVTKTFREGDKLICKINSRFKANTGEEVYVANGAFCTLNERVGGYAKLSPWDSPQMEISVGIGDLHSVFDLGYAVSCHKMQGSQAPCVFTALSNSFKTRMVSDRSWLYTALTRAQTLDVVAGTQDTINEMCSRTNIMRRKSYIPRWLTEEFNGERSDCTIHGRS